MGVLMIQSFGFKEVLGMIILPPPPTDDPLEVGEMIGPSTIWHWETPRLEWLAVTDSDYDPSGYVIHDHRNFLQLDELVYKIGSGSWQSGGKITHTFHPLYIGLHMIEIVVSDNSPDTVNKYAGIQVNQDTDTDGDGLWDHQEEQIGSRVDKVDTDDDGLTDYEEYYTYHTYFWNPDSDADLLWDKYELEHNMNPKSQDSDGDGVNDLLEIAYGLQNLDPNDFLPQGFPTEPSQSFYHTDDPEIQGKFFTDPIVFSEIPTWWGEDDLLGGFQVGFSDADFSEEGKIIHETGNIFVDLAVEINDDKDLDTDDHDSYNVIDSLGLYISVLKNDDEFLSFEQICQTLSGEPNPKFSIENDEPTSSQRASFILLKGVLSKLSTPMSWIITTSDILSKFVPDSESDTLSFEDLGTCSAIKYDFSDTTALFEKREIYGIKMCVDLLHQFNSLTSDAQNGDTFKYFMRMEVGLSRFEIWPGPTSSLEKNNGPTYNYFDYFQFVYEN